MSNQFETEIFIEIYHAKEDDFIGDINITSYGFPLLREIAPPLQPDDPDYYDPRPLQEHEFNQLRLKIKELVPYQFADYFYCIQTRQA